MAIGGLTGQPTFDQRPEGPVPILGITVSDIFVEPRGWLRDRVQQAHWPHTKTRKPRTQKP